MILLITVRPININEDQWSEDEAETPARVTDSMSTAPDFVTDTECQYILNVEPGERQSAITYSHR